MPRLIEWIASILARCRPALSEGEDARLSRLAEEIALSREELRQLRAKLPAPSTSYDEEGDQPF